MSEERQERSERVVSTTVPTSLADALDAFAAAGGVSTSDYLSALIKVDLIRAGRWAPSGPRQQSTRPRVDPTAGKIRKVQRG